MYVRLGSSIGVLVGLLFLAGPLFGADWSRFRGPNGSGVCTDEKPLPVTWSEDENLAWKVALPGPGSSSPILVGDRVFVTCWSGYGTDPEAPGDPKNLRRHLLCLDRATGGLVWSRSLSAVLPEDPYGGMFAQHGYATHTPVSDGERIYAYFGKSGAVAFDLEGEILWQTIVGDELDPQKWGSSSSPILFEDLLIVTATAECEGLVALDKNTGEERWRQEAAGFNATWGTPVLAKVDANRTDLVIAVPGEIWGFDPRTGKMQWFARTMRTSTYCSSAIAHDGIVYAVESGRAGGGGVAIRAGGNGDVTDTHVVWAGRQSNRFGSPVIHEGRLYAISGGVLGCFDLESGNNIFKDRLPADDAAQGDARSNFMSTDYSSPIVADGKIYFATRRGRIHVAEAGAEMKSLGVNVMADGEEDFSASPAAGDGQLFLRSDKHLYCIANTPKKAAMTADAGAAGGSGRSAGGRMGGPGGRPGASAGGPPGGGQGGFDPAAIFASTDANGDGKLTGNEITGMLRDNLASVDTDHDEAVTLDEFRAGIARMFSRGREGGGQGGGYDRSSGGDGGNARRGGGDRRDPRAGRPDRPQRPAMKEGAGGN